MSQKTLDGKTDCRKARAKGCATIRFTGKNPEILEGILNVHKKHPCIKMTVNGEKLPENPVEWVKNKEHEQGGSSRS